MPEDAAAAILQALEYLAAEATRAGLVNLAAAIGDAVEAAITDNHPTHH